MTDEELVQKAMLDKPVWEPEDAMELFHRIAQAFLVVLTVILFVSVAYVMTAKKPNKPVPDCGSCKVYFNGVKK